MKAYPWCGADRGGRRSGGRAGADAPWRAWPCQPPASPGSGTAAAHCARSRTTPSADGAQSK